MTWAQVQKLPAGSCYIALSDNFFMQATIMPHELKAAYDALVAAGKHEQEFFTQADIIRAADALEEE